MKFGVIIAARISSARLPGKALLPLKNIPMICFLIRRIRSSKLAGKIIFATTSLPEDDNLASLVAAENIPVFRGANNDVVKRFVDAASEHNLEYVVRVTGDCPFVGAETLDYCLEKCSQFDYFDLATTKLNFPIGIDYEIYNAEVMEKLHKKKLNKDDREHLTKYIYDHERAFRVEQIFPKSEWEYLGKPFTVDTPEDYSYSQQLVEKINSISFSIDELLKVARS